MDTQLDRRAFMAFCGGLGLGSTLFPGVLWAHAATGAEITRETIACAEEIAGLEFTDEQRELMLQGLRQQQESIAAVRSVRLPNSVPPAIQFSPLLPGMAPPAAPARAGRADRRRERVALPATAEDVAFLPVTLLAELIRGRQLSSMELTRLYLDRIGRLDPQLHAVVTVTEERAMRQAREADEEIARGRYRGPLHGIPWGAKDLLSVRGYPTTWGTPPFREQVIDEDATVVRRLDAAGAVLVAKLSLGELAQGDVWFGGMTRNPWKLDQGSSGSSAGPGSATAAGLVGFSIGSETLGSISSPSTRNGVTGLRPTFGRVPRTGAMALSWTMDKLGPMCRSAGDCGLVLEAIAGADGQDPTAHDLPFRWDPAAALRSVRVGYVMSAFERDEKDYPNRPFDHATLDVLRSLGAELVPVELPDFPYDAMRLILLAEAGAAFDELTRSGEVDRMVSQGPGSWPNTFRRARFIPAVEYINANRIRTLVMRAWAELFQGVDVVAVPTSGTAQLLASNLTGHPAVILPNGFRPDGTPVSITLLGPLFREDQPLAVAGAYQRATTFHRERPPLG